MLGGLHRGVEPARDPMSHHDLYKLAEIYDIAFDFRDVPAECAFLRELCRKHAGREPEGFLELGAGPAWHPIEFARRGARATALDLSQAMVDYAREKARTQGVEIEAVRADMVRFEIPGSYDLAATLMDSSVYLLDNEAVLSHLACVADHLTDGGLYVLEMGHPRDVFGVGKSTRTTWDAERDGTKVHTEWGAEDDPFDPITQIRQVTVTIEYSGPKGSGTVTETAPERIFTANEFRALVTASARFEIVGTFGAMDANVPFSNEKAAWRMVPVLRKVS